MKSRYAMYSCDFETCNKTGEVKIATFIKIESRKRLLDINIKDLGRVGITYNIVDMFNSIVNENIFSSNIKNNREIVLWFTNGAKFDNHFIKVWLLENGFKNVLDKEPKINEFTILETEKQGIITLRVNYKNVSFLIRDFKLIESLSVKQKGEIVGIEKGSYKNTNFVWLNKNGDVDWEKLDWDKLSKEEWDAIEFYAKKDALTDAVYSIFYFRTFGYPKKFTKSGIAFEMAKKEVNKINKKRLYNNYIHLDISNTSDVWTKHYQGGINYINKNFMFKCNYDYNEYDEVKMYSSKMCFPLPIDSGRDYDFNGAMRLYRINLRHFEMKPNYYDSIGQGFIKADRKNLSTKYDWVTKEYAVAGSNYFVEFWDIEWEYIKKLYNMDYEIINTKYFASECFLKDTMDNLFKESVYYKKLKVIKDFEINSIKENDVKTKMNSVYGILGEKPEKENFYYDKNVYSVGDSIDVKDKSFIITSKPLAKICGYYKYRITNSESPEYRKNIYIASRVTALGRCDMYPHILSGKIIRVDTDGFSCIKDYKLDNSLIGTDMGKFKLETEKMYRVIYVWGYKSYFLSNDDRYHSSLVNGVTGRVTQPHKFKGYRGFNIADGTRFEDIDWNTVTGWSVNNVKVGGSPVIRKVEKNPNKQKEYIKYLLT